ncbi:MAG: PAS domain S-box protein [Candidatus Methanoperedens sp.]|nr:PAS domain S-box protein [Candidatus Methanoperedens sp.]
MKKILVVDDEPINVELLKRLLSEKYDVETAANGKEAFTKVKDISPDLILLDVIMPEIDGYEVCRQLKSDQKTMNIPIVMVTCLTDREDRIKSIEAGADDFLGKPIDFIELNARVKSLLRIKQYLEDLEESKNRYIKLYDFAPVGYFSFTRDGLIREVNLTGGVLLGLARQELMKCEFRSFVTPEDINLWDRHISNALNNSDKQSCELTLKRVDGSTLFVRMNSIRMETGNGTPEILSAITDITQRKLIENSLKESEDRYRQLVDFATFGIVIHSDHKIVYVNRAAIKMLGATKPEDLIGKPVLEIVPPEYHDLVRERIHKQEIGEIAPLMEEKFVKLDGTIIDVELLSIPFIYKGKQAMYGVFQDISDRKKAQEEIKKSLQEKEILLREIHHRVKNNMQIISSLLNLQSGYVEEEKYCNMLKECQTRILSMSLIHENLYQSGDFTRIELNDYIRDLVNNLFQSYATSESKIKINTNIETVSLGIDSAMPCGLIINELVSNSLKHAFPDGANGEINIAFLQKDENMFELIVSDNGIGIREDLDLQKIESMGLFLVKMLVEDQLEGEISLDRSKGTKFTIRFKRGN